MQIQEEKNINVESAYLSGFEKHWKVDLTFNNKEIELSVSVSYQDTCDLMNIDNIEFISGHENLTKEELDLIDSWIYDNTDAWML